MAGIIGVLVLVIWISLVCFLLIASIETGGKLKIIAIAAFLFVLVVPPGLVVDGVRKKEIEQPCAEYELRMHYNPATKTMMPMRVCILRGEWVTEDAPTP